jgi:hypothetical protein
MSNNSRYVIAHGKRILVKTLETSDMKAREAEKQQQFVKVPLQWAANAALTSGMPGAMVWILLMHIAWKTRSTVVSLSNVALKQYDIGRETKRRVLEKLVASKQIKLERYGNRNPVVTLLGVKINKKGDISITSTKASRKRTGSPAGRQVDAHRASEIRTPRVT